MSRLCIANIKDTFDRKRFFFLTSNVYFDVLFVGVICSVGDTRVFDEKT